MVSIVTSWKLMLRRSSSCGTTLMEMLVTIGIFSIISTLLLTIFLGSRDVENKSTSESDAFRAIGIAQEAIKEELKRVYVVNPEDGGEITTSINLYRPNLYTNGLPVITEAGMLSWDDCSENDTDDSDCNLVTYIYDADSGFLKRQIKNKSGDIIGEPRKVANLGKGGQIEFKRNENTIKVKITAYGYPYPSKNLPPSYYTIETQHLLEY